MTNFDDNGSINSELRYITIELMKIAAQRNASFEDVCQEFLLNANHLHGLIQKLEEESPAPARPTKSRKH